MSWAAGDGEEECERLGPGLAVLRDHIKPVKHHWHEAACIPDAADRAAASKVTDLFQELRGDEFTGEFVLRRFERFTSAEARTWRVGGTCACSRHTPALPVACRR